MSEPNFSAMSVAEFQAWRQRRLNELSDTAADPRASGRLAEAAGLPLLPEQAAASQDPYAPKVWGATEYDFVAPSGQRCRMRKIQPEELVKAGILDKLTRLPGLVEDGPIRQAEGLPPVKESEPSAEDIEKLMPVVEVLDKLMPLVVVRPKVYPYPPEDEERVPGRVYPDMIDLIDRVAIMERSVGGVKQLDAFRNGSKPAS